ncbi:hypothetical protein HMPREF1572_00789 [Gardnerella vaginalis JCP7275]|nr:hypothetical protein HMPREF1572_00789 [Gardnerella vaginalis JCP7275]
MLRRFKTQNASAERHTQIANHASSTHHTVSCFKRAISSAG